MTAMLEIVETVYHQEYRNHVYQFRDVKGRGIYVSRVPKEHQLWFHGVIHQMLNSNEQEFKPAARSGIIMPFETLEAAVKAAFEVADSE